MDDSEGRRAPGGADEDSARLWERALSLFSLVEARVDRVLLHEHGVQLASLMALGAVVHSGAPEPATVGDVARRLGVSVSSASRTLARLEHSGWVRRVHWPCDRRVSRMRATEAGRALWDSARSTLERELDASFGLLAFDERYAHIVARLCRGVRPPGHREWDRDGRSPGAGSRNGR